MTVPIVNPSADKPQGIPRKSVSQSAYFRSSNPDLVAAYISPAVIVLSAFLTQSPWAYHTNQLKRSIFHDTQIEICFLTQPYAGILHAIDTDSDRTSLELEEPEPSTLVGPQQDVETVESWAERNGLG